jgi:hypothetical protein
MKVIILKKTIIIKKENKQNENILRKEKTIIDSNKLQTIDK